MNLPTVHTLGSLCSSSVGLTEFCPATSGALGLGIPLWNATSDYCKTFLYVRSRCFAVLVGGEFARIATIGKGWCVSGIVGFA